VQRKVQRKLHFLCSAEKIAGFLRKWRNYEEILRNYREILRKWSIEQNKHAREITKKPKEITKKPREISQGELGEDGFEPEVLLVWFCIGAWG